MPRIMSLVGGLTFLLWLLAVTSTEASHAQENLDPDDVWSTWTIPKIERDWLRCGKRKVSPIYTPEMWMLLREEYHSVMESSPPDSYTSPVYYDGFSVDFETKVSVEKGRGNYAVKGIPKGSLIWKSTFTVAFRDGDSYRQFLRRVSPSMGCDVIMWTYTRRDREGKMMACIDLDAGSYTNSAESDEEMSVAVLDDQPLNTGCDLEMYATRDIREGEELAMDYSFHSGENGWVEMGLDEFDEEEGAEF